MLEIIIEKSFKKDIQRDKFCGKYSKNDFEILKILINSLQNEEAIDKIFKRHFLKGDLLGYESIHIKNDWLLIFKVEDNFLYLVMLGSHSQVYKKYK
ncbi:type II toxin-antitoxin system RelE/ParE family toxin [Aliarcobacter butzleri]|uniref:type II toxin-antitoxin system RelE/ParE family toxin n=1 Tax=Aliarcobacter butzleri TaxID=28197 RepID=UPI00263C85A4|nr:type II toxin-antitoxin system YafQ family toxin [Aliarcobacter butzleri]MDN5050573.1 type II toxin-antitoxin system YafQ family toxin [Aliarcobacter butzleri]MDN5057703.1 type II toxin-antitoxin system YafQ family toxin [Aliarcobacter butzleri]